MPAHTWTPEDMDCGSLGINEFWECRACGSCGGPVWYDTTGRVPRSSWPPYHPDAPGLKLSDDCDEAREQIAAHLQTQGKP